MLARLLLPLLLLVAVPAAAQVRSPFEGDARLARPVTVRWKKATLYDALQELSRKTGARLTPDRAIVDEPVMGSATGLRAREVLEQVAKLCHYTWVRTGGAPDAPTYLLFQSRAQKEEEENEINGARRAVMQALQEQLARCRRLASLPPDQFAREQEKSERQLEALVAGGIASANSNPQAARGMMDAMALGVLGTPTGRAMLDVVDGLTPYQWSMVQSGEPLVFSTRPAEGELPLPEAVQDRLHAASPGFPFPRSFFKSFGDQINNALDMLDQTMKDQWGKATGYKVTVNMTLDMGSQPLGMLRVAPEPVLAEGGKELAPVFGMAGLNLFAMPALLAEPKEDPAEREKRLAADPFLSRKAVLKLPPAEAPAGPLAVLGKSHRVADILPNVEEAFGTKLVADAYNRQAMSIVPPLGEGEISLYQVLDRLAGLTREWVRDGETIRLRSKTWAHDRRAEIPVRYMRRWLAQREKNGGLTLDDMAEIAATLRDEQVDSLMFSALEEGTADFTDFVMIPMNRDILRFYARLLPLQRQALQAGRKLPARELFAPQQAALLGLSRSKTQSMFSFVQGVRPRRTPEQLAGAVLSLERQEVGQNPGGTPRVQVGAAPAPAAGGGGPRVSVGAVNAAAMPSAVMTLRLTLADGQKDEYTIPLMRPAPPTTPAAPPPVKAPMEGKD